MSAFGTARIALNGTALRGTSAARTTRRPQVRAVANGGDIHVGLVSVHREAAMAMWSTTDLGVLLNLLNNAQTPMVVHSGAGLVVDFPQNNPSAPGWNSGSTTQRVAFATGHTYLNRLSWTPGQGMVAECSSFGLSADGTTRPDVSSLVAAPVELAPGVEWVPTACTIGGVSVINPASISIDFGNKAENNADSCYDAGLPQPRRILSAGAAGPIEIVGEVEGHGLSIAYSGGATLVVTLQRKEVGGPGFQTGNLVLTVRGQYLDDADRAGGTPGTRTCRVVAAYDGVNLPWSRTIP